MQFDSDKKTISALLNSKKQFSIPRFQREYSWEKNELKEFFDDIVGHIVLEENQLKTTEYFWGTMLFIGNFTDARSPEMEVVDGQQRLTTITIFLAALIKALQTNHNGRLADLLKQYIVFVNDNAESKAVLLNETPNPYFQRTVQRLDMPDIAPVKPEEQRIKEAMDFFDKQLVPKTIKAKFKDCGIPAAADMDTVELYRALRDQLLNSVIICICTPDKKQANMIFEILNAKGKHLDAIDLIKNEIFSSMTQEVPSDEAKLAWKEVTEKLCSRGEMIDLSVFYRHFWLANYTKVPDKKLFGEFKKIVKRASYQTFLEYMKRDADFYIKMITPYESDYQNKIEYKDVVYALRNLTDTFNISQTRIFLLSLFHCHNNLATVKTALLKKTLGKLEVFHFIYNSLFRQGTNKMEGIYCRAAVNLRQQNDREGATKVIEQLIQELDDLLHELIPDYHVFEERFIQLTYIKDNHRDNLKAKYAIQKIAMAESGSGFLPVDASIEHIKNEKSGCENAVSVGNIILLEKTINEGIPETADFMGKKRYYAGSGYQTVRNFLNREGTHDVWEEAEIERRAKELAAYFYTKILGWNQRDDNAVRGNSAGETE